MAKLMNWHGFHRKISEKRFLLFSARDLCRLFGVTDVAAMFLLHRYAKRGYIIRVKRGLYILPDAPPPGSYLANIIYQPSYISLTAALSHHGVIPETVYEVTSITTKSTRRFETLGKVYSYRSLQTKAYTGYRVEKENGFSFLMADPEKAFVDTCYFRLVDGLGPISRYDKEKLNWEKVLRYASLFENNKLTGMLKTQQREYHVDG